MSRGTGHPFPLAVERSMQRTPLMDETPGIWTCDGSLRDIYVHHTTVADWQWLLDRANSLGAMYAFDGLGATLPSAIDIFNNRSGGHLLTLDISKVTLHCHFFVADEIEIDINPREIKSEAQHEAVLRFVAMLANALAKPASITPENSPEAPFAVFLPDAGVWVVQH